MEHGRRVFGLPISFIRGEVNRLLLKTVPSNKGVFRRVGAYIIKETRPYFDHARSALTSFQWRSWFRQLTYQHSRVAADEKIVNRALHSRKFEERHYEEVDGAGRYTITII